MKLLKGFLIFTAVMLSIFVIGLIAMHNTPPLTWGPTPAVEFQFSGTASSAVFSWTDLDGNMDGGFVNPLPFTVKYSKYNSSSFSAEIAAAPGCDGTFTIKVYVGGTLVASTVGSGSDIAMVTGSTR